MHREEIDRERKREREIDEDERAVGIEQLEPLDDRIERNGDRDGGHEPAREDEGVRRAPAVECDAGEGVGRQGAEHDVRHHHRQRHDEAVPERGQQEPDFVRRLPHEDAVPRLILRQLTGEHPDELGRQGRERHR